MRLRDSIALTLPSFLLRLVLGITFVWVGCGKLLGTFEVSGDDAARLANLGVVLTPVGPGAPHSGSATDPAPTPKVPAPKSQPNAQPNTPPSEPLESLPGVESAPAPASTTPATTTPANPANPAGSLKDQADDIINTIKDKVNKPAPAPADNGATKGTADKNPADKNPGDKDPGVKNSTAKDNADTDPVKPAPGLAMTPPAHAVLTSVQYTPDRYAGTDFPNPVETRGVHGVTLMISKAADPGLTPDSQPIAPLMPPSLANAPWPVVLAWSAAITEAVAGAFLILGLLTRLSALGTLSVMIVAMWMTQFGPAALYSNDAILGFIPRKDNLFSVPEYMTLMWQLALASMSLSVVFLGSGAIGIDRLLFGSSPRDPYVHGDPKAGSKGGKGSGPAGGPTRSEFDRSPNPTP